MIDKTAVLIVPDGRMTYPIPENGTDYSLDELHRLVDCDTVQILGFIQDGIKMWCVVDDNGKLVGKDINMSATLLMQSAQRISTYDFIVGNALFCKKSMIK